MAYNAMVLFVHVHPQYQRNAPHRRRLFLRELSKSMLPASLSQPMSATVIVTAEEGQELKEAAITSVLGNKTENGRICAYFVKEGCVSPLV